ncbi:hypothetical protein [Streptomyces sp. NPDC007856]|uniref:hypothetical protein n=1 Tax=Streptomyces sp. NPDC007856 TaxID=3364781 RepID=UPI0036B4A08F
MTATPNDVALLIDLPAPTGLREVAVHLLLAAVPEFLGAVAAAFVVTVTSWGLQHVRRILTRTDKDSGH